MTKLTLNEIVLDTNKPFLVDFIAQHCAVSKSQIKKALNYGGGWLQKSGTKRLQRCRKAKQILHPNDRVEFYFDAQLLEAECDPPQCVLNEKSWGIWYKPANVVSQGSKFGDLYSMENQVARLSGQAKVFLIHRLDREASGLMVFAYSKAAAAALSEIWREGGAEKIYQVEVLGIPLEECGEIQSALDDKPARSHYRLLERRSKSAILEVAISTGRYHQIRRHMQMIGHPVLGDPRYGEGNKNKTGMCLVATKVAFPFAGKEICCELPAELRLK